MGGTAAVGGEERSVALPRGRGHRRGPGSAGSGGSIAKPGRCQFAAEYKLWILEETDRSSKPGGLGWILRCEGFYSSRLTAWCKARHDETILGLAPKKTGRKPTRDNPLEKRVHQLKGEVALLEKELATAKTILEVQGKDGCRAAWTELRGREELVRAATSIAETIGVQPRAKALGRGTLDLLSPPEAHSRASASPENALPGLSMPRNAKPYVIPLPPSASWTARRPRGLGHPPR